MAVPFTIEVFDINGALSQGVLSNDFVVSGNIVSSIDGDESLTFDCISTHADMSLIANSRIVKIVHTTAGRTQRYRIESISHAHTERGLVTTVECLGLKFDLANRIFAFRGSIKEQTPLTHITEILAPTGFSVGTITPTNLITVDYDYNSVLFDLNQIAEITGYEIEVTDDLIVNLIRRGNQSSTSTVEFQKNIRSLTRYKIARPQASIMYGIGGAGDGSLMTIRNAQFRVTGVAGNVITLDSDKILVEDDALNGLFAGLLAGNRLNILSTTNITDSAKTAGFDEITVADATGIGIGSFIQFFRSADQELPVDYLISNTNLNNHGFIVDKYVDSAIEDVINLVDTTEDAEMSGTYTGGLHNGWTKIGDYTTTTENSNDAFIINGSKSQRVQCTAMVATLSAPTVNVISGEGAIAAGSYDYALTPLTTDGEGAISTATTAVVGADNSSVQVTFNDLVYSPNIIGYNVYRTKKDTVSPFYKVGQVINKIDLGSTSIVDTWSDLLLTQNPNTDTDEAAGGQGIVYPFSTQVGTSYSAIIFGHVNANGGRIRPELRSGDVIFPSPALGEKRGYPPSSQSAVTPITITMHGFEATNTTSYLYLLAHKGTADFYIDSFMIMPREYAVDDERFIATNGGRELWIKTCEYFTARINEQKEVDLDLADLYALDSMNKLEVGDALTFDHSLLGINETIRVTRQVIDIFRPTRSNYDFEITKKESKEVRTLKNQRSLVAAIARTNSLSKSLRAIMEATSPSAVIFKERG